MTRTLMHQRVRRALPALAALVLAAGSLTACSTGAGDITAPALQEADAREDGAPRVEAAVTTNSRSRSGYLLSTGKGDDEQGDDDQ